MRHTALMPSNPLVDHCLELLAPLGAPRARRMFGGHGLYVDDLFVALVAFDRLYLKADDDTRPRFEAAGCQPFTYPRQDGQAVTLGYWSAPDEALDSPGAMLPWARLALAAALKARQAAPRKVSTRRRATEPAAKAAAPAASGAARRPASARPKR